MKIKRRTISTRIFLHSRYDTHARNHKLIHHLKNKYALEKPASRYLSTREKTRAVMIFRDYVSS